MSHANNSSFREPSAGQNASTNILREKQQRKWLSLFAPQTKAEQRNERQPALEQSVNNSWRTPIDDERHLQLQWSEANNS